MRLKVCMFVFNNCTTDARVLKEAASLAKNGYKVKIMAIINGPNIPEYEVRDGVEIIRVIKNPIHYRIFNGQIFTDLFKKKQKNKLEKLRESYQQNKSKTSTQNQSQLPLNKLTFFQLIKKLKEEARNNTLNLILYRWFFYISLFGLKVIKRVIYTIITYPLRSIFMLYHKPLSFHDFYKKSLEYNKEEPADIYHGHDLHTIPGAYKTAKLTNAKVVYDAHELYTEMSGLKPKEKKYYTKIEKKYAPKVDALITVNESIANELVERYNLIKKPKIIYNCPEVNNNIIISEEDVLRKKLNLSSDTKIVLYQGGFTINRGLFNLIKSAKFIKNAKVVFMGWGSIEPDLHEEVVKQSVEDKVLFTPGVPQNELLNNTKSANVGVIPYQFVGLNNYYTSPNKLFEYINASVPIAGSDFPELKRVIEKYDIGETFDPESPESIAEAVNKILENESHYKQLKENTKFAAKDFTWENEEKKLIDIYHTLENE